MMQKDKEFESVKLFKDMCKTVTVTEIQTKNMKAFIFGNGEIYTEPMTEEDFMIQAQGIYRALRDNPNPTPPTSQ